MLNVHQPALEPFLETMPTWGMLRPVPPSSEPGRVCLSSRSGLELCVVSREILMEGVPKGWFIDVLFDPDTGLALASAVSRAASDREIVDVTVRGLKEAHVGRHEDVLLVCDHASEETVIAGVLDGTGIRPDIQRSLHRKPRLDVERTADDLLRNLRAEIATAMFGKQMSSIWVGHRSLIMETFVQRAIDYHNAVPFGVPARTPVQRWIASRSD